MYNEPPQWPDRPPQAPVGRQPQPRNRVLLSLVAIVAGVLIVALIGTLVLILSHGAQGNGAIGEQSAAAATATAAAGSVTNGQPTAISATATLPQSTPTNTPPSAAPTATTIIVCCLTLVPSVHEVVKQVTLAGTDTGPVTVSCPSGEIAL